MIEIKNVSKWYGSHWNKGEHPLVYPPIQTIAFWGASR